MKVHRFQNSLIQGNKGEDIVSKYFTDLGFKVSKLSVAKQKKLGYDLLLEKDDVLYGVEVKTEHKAQYTNNIFYETICDSNLGWCVKYSETSNVTIVWYLPHLNELLILPARDLKQIEYEKFKKVTVTNLDEYSQEYYEAEGHLIPLTYMKDICKVIKLESSLDSIGA